MHILIVDSNSRAVHALTEALEAECFAVDVAPPTTQPTDLAIGSQYDAIILSLTFWNLDWLQKLRARGIVTPILGLDYSGSAQERCRAIARGADDCITHPFLLSELLIRVQALLRRPHVMIDKLQVSDLVLDRVRRMAIRNGRSVRLTPKEFAILEYLIRNAGRPVTRTMLVDHVWNDRSDVLTNIVDVYINALRSKIDRGFDTKLIRTAYGVGYMISGHSENLAA